MPAPDEIVQLVDRFDFHRDSYVSAHYNEAQVRQEFINPLFKALGWDMDNEEGNAEAYKDVVHEDTIKVSGATKAPDYSFRIGGVRKFFVEAKKPAVSLKEDAGSAYQLRRYAWSAKLPLSILTDFQEFAVYDCRGKPSQNDRASVARVTYLTYKDYLTRWDDIAGIFSRKAIPKGSFDKYAESNKAKRGTAEVDDAFLQEMETWREELAQNIALRNPSLSQRQLNAAVQMTIDRIIFLRIGEDRGTEPYGRLFNLTTVGYIYDNLRQVFREADGRYNSGLFHFQNEAGRSEAPDALTLTLNIDDKCLKKIITSLYYPESPYEFSVLPADILGQVYEQFLGKVIRLAKHGAGHRAIVEEKPEVRKAGGVYYTPTYIVEYIVKHTLGKWLEGKRTKEVENLKVLDPACGSGSFLLVAFQYLLDWHRDEYMREGTRKHRKELQETETGEWRLTTAERKRILLNNIHGVDIDAQAVEVTKLSLLLKVLEGETKQAIDTQLSFLHERALPDLAENIKWGNSLISTDFYNQSTDFYNQQQMDFLDDEERYRVNPFDWETEFPGIFERAGEGFDVVIGNPPYFNVDDTWGKGDPRKRYLKAAYPSVYNDKTDVLYYFLAKAAQLSRGEVAFIVSRAFLEAYKADKLRGWLAAQCAIRGILDFRNFYVFRGAGITTAIVTLAKGKSDIKARVCQLSSEDFLPSDLVLQVEDDTLFKCTTVDQVSFTSEPWVFLESAAESVVEKIDARGDALGQILLLGQGMQTGRNSVFGNLTKAQIEEWGLEEGQYLTRARNSDILRYQIRDSGELLLYLEDVKRFEDLPSGVQAYLKSHERELKSRAAYQRGDCEWWRYTWPLHREHLDQARLYCPYLATDNRFALDEEREYLGLTDTTVLYDPAQAENLRYILGLLNSKLLTFRFRFIGKLKSAGIREYFWNGVSKLRIRRIDFASASDRARHDRMVSMVNQMMSLRKQLVASRTVEDTTALQRQVAALDKRIDSLVYELYGLTDGEIRIVEAIGAGGDGDKLSRLADGA